MSHKTCYTMPSHYDAAPCKVCAVRSCTIASVLGMSCIHDLHCAFLFFCELVFYRFWCVIGRARKPQQFTLPLYTYCLVLLIYKRLLRFLLRAGVPVRHVEDNRVLRSADQLCDLNYQPPFRVLPGRLSFLQLLCPGKI